MNKISEVSARLYKEDENQNDVRLLIANLTTTPKTFQEIINSLSKSMVGTAFYIGSNIDSRLGIIRRFSCDHGPIKDGQITGSITLVLRPEFLVKHAMEEEIEITCRLFEFESEYTFSAGTEENHWWKQFTF